MKPYDASAHFNTAGAVDNYTLQNAPIWMDIDPVTGLITGQGSVLGELTENITVTGTNELGFAVSNTFSIEVAYVETEYWRIYITDKTGAFVYFKEMEMRATIGGADQCEGGIADASSYFDSRYIPEYAFDNSLTSQWLTTQALPSWLSYAFTSPVSVLEFSLYMTDTSPKDFQLQYSYDNINWTSVYSISNVIWTTSGTKVFPRHALFSGTIADFDTTLGVPFFYESQLHIGYSGGDVFSYVLNNAPTWMDIDINTGLISGTPDTLIVDTGISVTYTTGNGQVTSNTFSTNTQNIVGTKPYWRIYITDKTGAFVYFKEMEMRATIGGADQCEGGIADASSYSDSRYIPEYAFDNSLTSQWMTNQALPSWLSYAFTSPVSVLEFSLYMTDTSPKDFQLEYSHDNINWTSAYSISNVIWTTSGTKVFPIHALFSGTIADFDTTVGTPFLYESNLHIGYSGGDVFSYALNNAPTWMDIDVNTGLISGTPDTVIVDTGISVTYTTGNGQVTSNTFSTNSQNIVGTQKYWRILTTAKNGVLLETPEIEMRATISGADQCSGGIANASAWYGSNTPDKAFDDNTGTLWQTDSATPIWISYEFSSSVAVLEFTWRIHSAAGYSPADIQLEYSHDNINWTDVYSTIGLTWAAYETKAFVV